MNWKQLRQRRLPSTEITQPSCTKLQQVAPICTKLHQVAPNCTNLHLVTPSCTNLHQITPRCTKLHQVAPNCTNLHQVAPNWTSCTKLKIIFYLPVNTDKPNIVAFLVFICLYDFFVYCSNFVCRKCPKRDAILALVAKQWIAEDTPELQELSKTQEKCYSVIFEIVMRNNTIWLITKIIK